MTFVAIADQRVCLPVENSRRRDGDRKWVSLRELLQGHLGKIEGASDEERVALALMGKDPQVWLESQGGVEGTVRTFRMGGALDIDPHYNGEQKMKMEQDKVAFAWSVPQSGLFLRYPVGVRARGTNVNYEDFQS